VLPALVRAISCGLCVLLGCAHSTATPPSATTAACAEPERRQLDFWIGNWDLVIRQRADPKSDEWSEAKGTNSIRATLSGCAIEENFHGDGPGAPWAGRSFSTWEPLTRQWRQTWVDDSGSYLAFRGGPEGGGFVLLGEPKPDRQMRMVFSQITPDSIFWTWERRSEGGSDWAPVMTIAYTRRNRLTD
jgi:hypothetical protein